MGDSAIIVASQVVAPGKITSKTIPTASLFGGNMTADDAAGCKKGGEETSVAQETPMEGPLKVGVDALPRTVSSTTQPDAPGDTANGAEMFVPVEAETPQRPERQQRQQAPSESSALRPPIRTFDSNAESVVDSWEGAAEQRQRSSPTASTSAPRRKRDLEGGGGAAGGAEIKGPVGALLQPTKGTKAGQPISPPRVSGGEDGAESGKEDEPREGFSPSPGRGQKKNNAGCAGESGANRVDCAFDSPRSIGPERTVAPGSLLSPGGGARNHGEEGAAVAATGGASAMPDATVASPPAAATADTSVASCAAGALPGSSVAGEGGEEEEQVVVSGNNPLYHNGPGGASCGNSASGMSTPFSPVRMEPSGGNATRGGAAAEASTDPVSNSTGGGPSTPKAAKMLARFRSAARGGGASLFSRRATVAPNPPRPPAPDAGPAERAPTPGAEASAKSTGDALPAPMGPDCHKGGADTAPAFGAPEKTPLVSPLRSSSSRTKASSSASSPEVPAGARREVEGDVEDGGARAAVAAAVDGGVAVTVAAEESASQVVLPCAPTDEEKALYDDTGRLGLVACAIIAFVALSCGMWLFTLVTPAFYWFGAPATFIVFYTAAHYFAVAMWGKDFNADDHAEVVRHSEEKRFRPTVDVFLPVCKEPLHLLANTWRHVEALDYPDVKVFVLDDGKSDEVKALAATFGFEYVVRANAPELKKAGNLRNAFGRTSGEAIAIFDADFCPRPDFLKETVPYLGEDPSIGIVQTPQFFRYREEQTWVEKGAGVTQEFFYRMVQVNQDRFNAAVCVGSCGLYRRAALEPLGGMAAIEHSEDMYTGYKMAENGFKIKYVPLALAMGICPDEPQSFFMQQYRWCKGSATLVTEKDFWRSGISRIHKLCFLNGLLYYMATALLVFIAPMPILLLVWVEADGVLWYHSGFVLPSVVFASVVMPLWSKQPYGMSCHRVKIIQCYAHVFAIKDSMLGRSAPWVPSGLGGSRFSSSTYKSSVRLLIGWNVLITALIVGGSAWRMTALTWYHFLPAVVLAVGSFALNISTLVY